MLVSFRVIGVDTLTSISTVTLDWSGWAGSWGELTVIAVKSAGEPAVTKVLYLELDRGVHALGVNLVGVRLNLGWCATRWPVRGTGPAF